MIEVELLPDGTEYRFVLQQDPDPQEPYDDGGWPILRVIYSQHHGQWVADAFNKQAVPYIDKFNALVEVQGDTLKVFERYLRIFQGATQFHTFGIEDTRSTDYTYIAFDTKTWHEAMGFLPNNVEDLAKEKPLAEVRAWLEDDVWGYRIDKRYNPDKALAEHEGWDEEDSCWGFYGHKTGEDAARAALKAAVESHKPVHRYTEHEKLVAHETEVRTILEFLETHTLQGHTAVRGGHQQMVYEHFGIDYKKIQEERELVFKRLQEEEHPQ